MNEKPEEVTGQKKIQMYWERLEELGVLPRNMLTAVTLMLDPEKVDVNKMPEEIYPDIALAIKSSLEKHFALGKASYFQEGKTPPNIYDEHVRKTPFYLP